MSIESFEREHKLKRRQDYLNRTWRNPRYYTVFPILPIAFLLIILPTLFNWFGSAFTWIGEHSDDALRVLWFPYRRWIERGAKP